MSQLAPDRPRGRPSRYAPYESLLRSLPEQMKRPLYTNQIGLLRGKRGVTAYVKIRLARGAGRELKLGGLRSWSWQQLETKRDELQGRADRGEPLVEAQSVSFASHAVDWLARKEPVVKAHDILRGHVRKHLLPAFGSKSLEAISAGDVNLWISNQRRTLKAGTVQRQLSTLNAILNDAVRCGLITRNPAKFADPIRGVEARARFLGHDDLKRVLETAWIIEAEDDQQSDTKPHQKRGWLSNFILWALQTGMRRQEILNLRWPHVQRLGEDNVVIDIPTSKSGKPRKLNCNDEMLRILDRLRVLDRAEGDDRVFPVSLSTLKRKLTALWKATCLEDVRLHDLRRTHASVLVREGIDMRTVAGMLGHRDTSMLQKHYAVFLGGAEASKKAEQAFSYLTQLRAV